ncbi:MAG: hypothetical protein P8Z30_02205 [Acidobacteriota bacterium]
MRGSLCCHQLFHSGNNPLDPSSAYGNAGFDRTHVVAISYHYNLPRLVRANSLMGKFINGWGMGGITVLESGQPFSIYDYSGSVAGLYFSADDFITNPLLPIAQGKTVSKVQAQGTTGVNAGKPYFDPNSFIIPTLQPGTSGVPPCGAPVGGTSTNFCDNVETTYGATRRNVFRAPFQSRFDFALQKSTRLTERFSLNYQVEFFNLFNHPGFDAPNNDVKLNHCYNPIPCYVNPPSANQGIEFIQETLGSARFIQMALHLNW